MNKATTLLWVLAFTVNILSVTLHAQSVDSLFPKLTLIARPEKVTKSPTLNNFLNQSFQFQDKMALIYTNLKTAYLKLNKGTIGDLNDARSLFAEFVPALQAILPNLQGLFASASEVLEKSKKEIGVFEVLKAASNFKTAMQALQNAVGLGKTLLTQTVPAIKLMLPAPAAQPTDTLKTAQ